MKYISEQITNPALVELTFTFYIRLRKWQMSISKKQSILYRMMETMSMLTLTHACYLPVTVLKAGNRTLSKNMLGTWPQEVHRTGGSCSGMNGHPLIEIRALKERNPRTLG